MAKYKETYSKQKLYLISDALMISIQDQVAEKCVGLTYGDYNRIMDQMEKKVVWLVFGYALYGIDHLLDDLVRVMMSGAFDVPIDVWDRIIEIDAREDI